jgi:proline iminopeptidase
MSEAFLDIDGRRTWYRTLGTPTALPALLVLHGGPGGASADLRPFEPEIARERLVVVYDQLEGGRSQRLGDPSVLTTANFVAELNRVRDALSLDRVHVWGQSWGGMLAMEYALTHPAGLVSIGCASAPYSCARSLANVARYRAALPATNRRALERFEKSLIRRPHKPFKAGDGPTSAKVTKQAQQAAKMLGIGTAAPIQALARAASYVPALRRRVFYELAGLVYLERHIVKGAVTPELISQQTGANMAVYEHLWGPSEFFATGPIRDFDVTDRLHEIDVPVLVTTGTDELLSADDVAEMQARVPDMQWELFEHSAHCAEFEEPDRYTAVLRDFLTKVDGRSPRAVPAT